MNENNQSPNKKIFVKGVLSFTAALIVLIVGFYAFFGFTTAWFSKNNIVDSRTKGVQVKYDDDVAITSMYIYKYNPDDEQFQVYEDDPEAPEKIHLNQFDSVFEERRADVPIIIKVELEYATNRQYEIQLTSTGQLLANGKMIKNISNILTFRCGINTAFDSIAVEDNSNPDDVESFYRAATAFFEDSSKKYTDSQIINNHYQQLSFPTYTVGSDKTATISGKNDTIVFTVDTRNLSTTSGSVCIYFYVSYDEYLVNRYLTDNIGALQISVDEFGKESNIVKFDPDLGTILFTADVAKKKNK